MVMPPPFATDEAKRTFGRQRPETQSSLLVPLPEQAVVHAGKNHFFPLGTAKAVSEATHSSSAMRFIASPRP